MKNFCTNFKEHATKIINYEKKRDDTVNKQKRKKYIVSKKFVIYAQKDLVLMMTIKNNVK